MDTEAFLRMDIFFFITTAALVLFAIFGAVTFYYIIKIVRSISKVISLVEREAAEISEDFKDIKKEVKEGVHDVREGILTATNYTKTIAGAGIVKALSGLFEAFVDEREQRKRRKKTRKKST